MVMMATAAERVQARRSILTCTACELRGNCTRPVPWYGDAPNRELVVGEAPGAQEDKEGRPFVGPAGKLLRRLMGEVGIRPETLTWANTVSCWPGKTIRTPLKAHIDACAPNLGLTLQAVRPHHILVVGSVALKNFRADLTITQARGNVFWLSAEGPVCFPVIHPSAALREPTLVGVIRTDLERWARIVEALDPRYLLEEDCVICGSQVDRYDPDGIPWCQRHYDHKAGVGHSRAVAARARIFM